MTTAMNTQRNSLLPEQLGERADYFQDLIETRMIDPDGLVYSFINGETLKPFQDRQIPDRLRFNVMAAPKKLWKSGMWNYEDCEITTSQYLVANIYRYRVTHEKSSLKIVRRCFEGLKKVAEAGAKHEGAIYKSMFGFFPKPYGGIGTAHLSGEVSVDQYQQAMYALEMYGDTLATSSEKRWIKKFLAACADCWDVNNYTFRYFSRLVRWGIDSPHSVAFGLYCSSVGAKLSRPHHADWFKVFMSRTAPLEKKLPYHPDPCLVLQAMKRLCHYRPEMKRTWLAYAKRIGEASMRGVDAEGFVWLFGDMTGRKRGERVKPGWRSEPSGDWTFEQWRGNLKMAGSSTIGGVVDLYDLIPNPRYLRWAADRLAHLGRYRYLHYLEPLCKQDLPRGYEILKKQISGPNTAMWLRAYWQIRSILIK